MILDFEGKSPSIAAGCFIADSAQIIGDVSMGDGSSVWFNAVIRGDVERIRIGRNTNIQDMSVLHVDTDAPVDIGDWVTVGHNAIVHGCTIGDGAMIGMGAIVMNGAKVGEGAIVGAGALVPEGTTVPPRSLVLGVPGKIRREVSEEEISHMRANTELYVRLAASYKRS